MDIVELGNTLIEEENIIANDNDQEFIQLSNESSTEIETNLNCNTELIPHNNSISDNTFIIRHSTSTYVDEIETPGQNIIIKEPSRTIQSITIDLLIKKTKMQL